MQLQVRNRRGLSLQALLLSAVIAGAGCFSDDSFKSTELGNMPPMDFTLMDQDSLPFTLSEQKGKVVMMFFGFTYCPDVCPQTLSNWKKVQDELGKDAEQVKFVYITVDPERDTTEKMKKHLAIFSDRFVGLTGSEEALQKVYSDYGVYREKVEISESAAGYLVNHTARMYVLDRQGRWRLSIRNDAAVQDIVHDLRLLLQQNH